MEEDSDDAGAHCCGEPGGGEVSDQTPPACVVFGREGWGLLGFFCWGFLLGGIGRAETVGCWDCYCGIVVHGFGSAVSYE